MQYNYYAFISYSRKDKRAAKYLQRQMESYRYPAVMVDEEHRPENPKYLRKVFRDTSDLEVDQNNFDEAVKRHIADSHYLIVICSPNSRESKWVDHEIAHFLETHDNDPRLIFPIILDGDVPDCLPVKLCNPEFRNRNIPTMIPDDDSSRKDGWEHGFLQLVSGLLNVSFGKISDRFQKAKQAALRRIIFGALTALAVTIGLTAWALFAEHKARVAEQKAIHEAKVAKETLKFIKDAFNAADATKAGNKDMTLLEFAKNSAPELDKLTVPEVKLQVAEIILSLLGNMGDPKTALNQLLPLMQEAERTFPPESLERANFHFALAGLLHMNARHREAIEYYQQALKAYRKKLGEENANTAVILNNIGVVHMSMGERSKAIEYYRQALKIHEKLGKNHWAAGNTLNNIGTAYQNDGKYDKAIEYYRQALEIFRKRYGDDHFQTAIILDNIGIAYQSKGEHDKAIEHFRRALPTLCRKIGAAHPYTANILDNIGWSYQSQGEYDKAIEYHRLALTIFRKKFDDAHPQTARALNNIGTAYQSKGEHDKAIEYYRQAVAIKRKKLGNDHSATANTLNNIGTACLSRGEYDKAIGYFLQALEIYRQTLGNVHHKTAMVLDNIGIAYQSKGEHDKALEYSLQALPIFRATLGKDHLSTAMNLNNIGWAYQGKGEYDKAIGYYRQSLAINRKKSPGLYHPGTANVETGLGYSLVMTGHEDEGLMLLDHALAVQMKKPGPDHQSTAESYHFSGLARLELAKRNKSGEMLTTAEKHLKKALGVRMKKLGSGHPETKETIQALERLKKIRSECK